MSISSNLFGQNKQLHIVRSGETLYSISKKLGVNVDELSSWNRLTNNTLSIGQELVYFTASLETTEEPYEQTERGASLINISIPQQNEYYAVKSGDNLTSIARKHKMTVSQLRELNNIKGDLLRIGQQLAVRKIKDRVAPSTSEYSEKIAPQGAYVIYTVDKGETTEDILAKFEITYSELQQLNPEINLNSLDKNERIIVLLPPSNTFKNPYSIKANLQDLGLFSVSVYENSEIGNVTTSGELYNPNELTAAHSNITIGSILYIENPETGLGIYVRINDRITESGLKLSNSAFRILRLTTSEKSSVIIYKDT